MKNNERNLFLTSLEFAEERDVKNEIVIPFILVDSTQPSFICDLSVKDRSFKFDAAHIASISELCKFAEITPLKNVQCLVPKEFNKSKEIEIHSLKSICKAQTTNQQEICYRIEFKDGNVIHTTLSSVHQNILELEFKPILVLQ